MNAEQIAAFNQSSGITVNGLSIFIVTVLFVIAIIWAIILLGGKMKAMMRDPNIDVNHIFITSMRILAVVVIVLFLVNT